MPIELNMGPAIIFDSLEQYEQEMEMETTGQLEEKEEDQRLMFAARNHEEEVQITQVDAEIQTDETEPVKKIVVFELPIEVRLEQE